MINYKDCSYITYFRLGGVFNIHVVTNLLLCLTVEIEIGKHLAKLQAAILLWSLSGQVGVHWSSAGEAGRQSQLREV